MKLIKRILLTLVITAMVFCSVGCVFKRKINNVFDKLYYEVRAVERGKDSVLLTGPDDAEVDYDFGEFENIAIYDFNLSIFFERKTGVKILYFLFSYRDENFYHSEEPIRYVLYRYDLSDRTLYGEMPLEHLESNFLMHYFEWCNVAGEENQYSLQDLGEFTFILQEYVYYY